MPRHENLHMSSDYNYQKSSEAEYFMRLPDVKKKTGKSRSSIYRDIQLGKFPTQYELGSSRSVGWLSTDIDEWMKNRSRKCANARSSV